MINENTIRKISARLNEPEWMIDRRLEAFEKFKEMSMPNFRYGIGISVDISELDLNNIDPLEDKSRCKIDANENVEALSFYEAFFNSGILIRIPENTEIKKPVELHLDLNGKARIDHILVIAERNSKAIIVDYSSSKNNEGFRNQMVEIIAKENARIEYRSVQNFSQNVYSFSKKRAHVERDAFIQ